MIFAVTFFIAVIISLFILFMLSENDFVLIRRNITLPIIFNRIFIALFFSILIGRFFYVIDCRDSLFINPFVFFHFLNHEGFSLFGGFLGITASVIFLIKDKKALGRILDIVSLSFYPFLFLFILYNPFASQHLILKLGIALILFLLFKTFANFHKSYSMKDGSLFYVILITFAHFNILSNLYNYHNAMFLSFAFSDFISMFVIISAILLLVKNERKFLLRR